MNVKKEFFKKAPGEIYGYLHKAQDNQLLGGVEFLPSIMIPYPVPHEEETAFNTCIYCLDPKYDYKSAPLRELENFLKQDYRRIIYTLFLLREGENARTNRGVVIFFLNYSLNFQYFVEFRDFFDS